MIWSMWVTATLLDHSAWQQAASRLDGLHRSTDRKAAARAHLAAIKARSLA
jgi:hypothetical protein